MDQSLCYGALDTGSERRERVWGFETCRHRGQEGHHSKCVRIKK